MDECRDGKYINPPSFALILNGFGRILYKGPCVVDEVKGVSFNSFTAQTSFFLFVGTVKHKAQHLRLDVTPGDVTPDPALH